nr:hypothetical protein [Streptomyces triticiradicis]
MSLVTASASGSHLPACADGAAQVIWVVGAQKTVPGLGTALRRVEEHALAPGRVSSRDHRVVLVRSLIQIIEAYRWRLAR